jgi:hypothetical protein
MEFLIQVAKLVIKKNQIKSSPFDLGQNPNLLNTEQIKLSI